MSATNVVLTRGDIVTGRQIVAARALLNWSQKDLAAAAGVHPKSIAYWERIEERRRLGGWALNRVKGALLEHGVEFIGGEGAGVRMLREG